MPGGLELHTAYWRDDARRHAFQRFVRHIHGLDFARWEQAGYWDDDYGPSSLFLGGEVVASLCIYTLGAVVAGRPCRVAQVSGVGTDERWRRQGLNRRLHERALPQALHDHAFVFLFADDDAVPFYRRIGFRPVTNHAVVVALPDVAPDGGLQRVDIDDPAQRDALYRLAQRRAPVSALFSTHSPKLLMFHALYRRREHLWRIPALDAVVMMESQRGRTVVHDVIAERLPSFEALAPYLRRGGAREAELRFAPDALRPDAEVRFEPLEGHNVHVMGGFDLGPHPVIPSTSQA